MVRVQLKKCIIVSFGFNRSVLRLQPWRYVHEIASFLAKNGVSVSVLINSREEDEQVEAIYKVIRLIDLKPWRWKLVLRLLDEEQADVLVWPISPRTVFWGPLFDNVRIPIVGYVPGLMPNSISPCIYLVRHGLMQSFIEIMQWCLFGNIGFLNKFMRIFVQSDSNRRALCALGYSADRVQYVISGWVKKPYTLLPLSSQQRTFLFMGWPKKIRGIDILLQGFERAYHHDATLKLRILARGERGEDHERLYRKVKRMKSRSAIFIDEGFLTRTEINQAISECYCGILPFEWVPADRPLSFLDFFTQGKPVITTPVPGCYELVEDHRGLITTDVSAQGICEAMLRIVKLSNEDYHRLQENCFRYITDYPTWEESGERFKEVLDDCVQRANAGEQ